MRIVPAVLALMIASLLAAPAAQATPDTIKRYWEARGVSEPDPPPPVDKENTNVATPKAEQQSKGQTQKSTSQKAQPPAHTTGQR